MVYLITQLELLLRLVVSGICGALIGYERKNRLKEAGIRTHLLVALGATLIMIVSKYGFSDVLTIKGITVDPSRIAAQIVSGIGFLGAGMIFIRNQTVNGLTTAAGIWATAGVGMAIGAKLYFIGIIAAALIIIAQVVLHKNFKWIHIPIGEQINIQLKDDPDSITFIQDTFASEKIEIITIKVTRNESGLAAELFVKLPDKYDRARLMNLFKSDIYVKSVEY